MHIIEVKNLTKDYGNQKGIFDVSFEIHKGKIVGFLGPNGAGKTTTIRHLLGFIRSNTGTAHIDSLDCFKDQVLIQEKVGYLPGEINFIDDLNGDEFMNLIAKMKKLDDLSYANRLLEIFDLNPKQPIKKMSKGMKQKLGIVLAFMTKPEILILDEPSSGLDPLMQQKLVDLILEHKKMGATVFLSSHIFEEVEKTCDRVIMIKNGKIVADNSIQILKEQRVKAYQIEFENEDDCLNFSKKYAVEHVSSTIVIYQLETVFNDLLKALLNYKIKDIARKVLNLEEVFMQYYGV